MAEGFGMRLGGALSPPAAVHCSRQFVFPLARHSSGWTRLSLPDAPAQYGSKLNAPNNANTLHDQPASAPPVRYGTPANNRSASIYPHLSCTCKTDPLLKPKPPPKVATTPHHPQPPPKRSCSGAAGTAARAPSRSRPP